MAAAFGVTLRKVVAHEGLVFSTGDLNGTLHVKLGSIGVCAAMVADWIEQGRKLGRTVKSELELSPATAYALAYVDEDFNLPQDEDFSAAILERFSLNPHKAKTYEPVLFSQLATDLATRRGYLYVALSGDRDGHALGFRIQDTVFEYFDPNVGLYRNTSPISFVSHLVSELTARYDDLKNSAEIWDVD